MILKVEFFGNSEFKYRTDYPKIEKKARIYEFIASKVVTNNNIRKLKIFLNTVKTQKLV